MNNDNRRRNRALCERYPFLIPSRFDGRRVTECPEPWDYEYTALDDMPDGWRRAFGERLCEELRNELERAGILDRYRILQIKEKYGSLQWYDNGNTETGYGILDRYEDLSRRTCIVCGRPATRVSTSWISPFCDACSSCIPVERYVPIEEYYGPNDGEVRGW